MHPAVKGGLVDWQRIGFWELWGLLWVVCIKMAANAGQSCCRHIFEFCL